MTNEHEHHPDLAWQGIVDSIDQVDSGELEDFEVDLRPRFFLHRDQNELLDADDFFNAVLFNKEQGILTDDDFDVIMAAAQAGILKGEFTAFIEDSISYEQTGNITVAVLTTPGSCEDE